MSKIEYKELIAFHPGYYIKDMIEELGMTQDELSKRLETSGKYVSELVNGRIELTDEMALKLSIVFDTSVSMWLNLNKSYIEKKLEIARKKEEDKQCEIVKNIDYSFWVDLNLVDKVKKAQDKVRELQKYFKISSLEVLCRRDFLVQYRTAVTEVKDINVINSNAWVQTAINIGNEIETNVFDAKKLRKLLPFIRKMTIQNPEQFVPELKKELASCGIAFVILPTLKKSGVNGAVKWVGKEKVILAINDRKKFADVFWFSLFHELGHVLQEKKKTLIISRVYNECENESDMMQQLEEDADAFARNQLIPESEYNDFVIKGHFSQYDILEFAKKVDIHPGIVVGRLQKECYIEYSMFNSLKEKYYVTM